MASQKIDQPTPANLGNLTQAEFLSLPDWSVNPINQIDPVTGVAVDDTFDKMKTCHVALDWRVDRENFRWINEAFACRVDTPLSLKVAALSPGTGATWLPTDNENAAVTDVSGLSVPAPDMLFSCNGTADDEVTPGQELVEESTKLASDVRYSVVNARGQDGTGGEIVLGIRPTFERCYHTGTYNATVAQAEEIMVSLRCVVEWNQGTDQVILAQVNNTVFDGFGAMWEFGLTRGFGGTAKDQDWTLYFATYEEAGALPVYATTASGALVGITPGREFTLAFAEYETATPGEYEAKFFVNGVQVGPPQTLADISTSVASTDVRLYVGSGFRNAVLGCTTYCGGPISNVYVTTSIDKDSDHAAIANLLYKQGAGFP